LLGWQVVLETMTPLGFLEFRDYLFPASGFQSLQFRLIEKKLGLQEQKRMKYAGRHYCSYLPTEHSAILDDIKEENTLFRLLEKWLERTPFLKWTEEIKQDAQGSPSKKGAPAKFDFWARYEKGVNAMYDRDRDEILRQTSNFSNETVPSEETQAQLNEVENNRKHYSCLFDPEEHQEAVERGDRRLSYKGKRWVVLCGCQGWGGDWNVLTWVVVVVVVCCCCLLLLLLLFVVVVVVVVEQRCKLRC